MASFLELTNMDGHPMLVNIDHVLRISTTTATDPDLADSIFLHFSDGSRQLVQEPLREVLGLLNLREAEFHLSRMPA